MAETPTATGALRSAFDKYDREVILNNIKVGCLIGVLFMPLGTVLDWFVYPEDLGYFLKLRLLCSLLIGVFWFVVASPLGQRHPRPLGILLAMFPTVCMSLMIYLRDGSESHYYAGLNVVLLVIGFVLHWTISESIIAVSLVIAMYIAACGFHGQIVKTDFANNLYFLIVTGIIVAIGSFVHSRWRMREFTLRYNLDNSQRELKGSNEALNHKREELEQALVGLRQAQDQLVTKEKQASLGVWSAGIIHEINNPLNFARTGLYALRNKDKLLPADEQSEFREVVADIEDGIKRVHSIVSELRTYAHPGTEAGDQVVLAEVVRVALRFVSTDLQGRIEVIQKIPAELTAHAHRNKLIQVLGNLLQNSADALKLKDFGADHPTITLLGKEEDGRALLILHDNGPGIDPKHLDKIFDPFFTTKAEGEGMGLGLGICYRIMQEFGGTISVRSEPGQFSEFTLGFRKDESSGQQKQA
jgi:two-component system sensor histidine kinase PhcS